MTNWVYTSLVNSVGSLKDAGEEVLAADILRLVQSGQLQSLKVFRHEDSEALSNLIRDVRDTRALIAILRDTAKRFGANHATVHVVTETPSMTIDPRVVTTYPDEWIAHYVERGYTSIDPVILAARSGSRAFYWSDLDQMNPRSQDFFADAERFGIGSCGYTLPLRVWKDLRIALSLSATGDGDAFRANLEPQLSDYETIAEEIVAAFAELSSEEFRADRRPPLKLLRLLRGLSLGMSFETVCERYEITDIAKAQTEICTFYNATSLIQAAMICVRLKHLEGLPFELSDIASASRQSDDP